MFEYSCQNHNEMIHIFKTLRDLAKKEGKKEFLPPIQKGLEIARYNKKKVQHMENRLRKYRTAIEKLGFRRVK